MSREEGALLLPLLLPVAVLRSVPLSFSCCLSRRRVRLRQGSRVALSRRPTGLGQSGPRGSLNSIFPIFRIFPRLRLVLFSSLPLDLARSRSLISILVGLSKASELLIGRLVGTSRRATATVSSSSGSGVFSLVVVTSCVSRSISFCALRPSSTPSKIASLTCEVSLADAFDRRPPYRHCHSSPPHHHHLHYYSRIREYSVYARLSKCSSRCPPSFVRSFVRVYVCVCASWSCAASNLLHYDCYFLDSILQSVVSFLFCLDRVRSCR